MLPVFHNLIYKLSYREHCLICCPSDEVAKRESKSYLGLGGLNYSKHVTARKHDFVSLTYARLRLRSRRGCSDNEASNRQYIENIRLKKRSNQACHKTSQEGGGNWVSSEEKELSVATQKCRLHKSTPRQE